MPPPLLQAEHIRKQYPGVLALDDVDFTLEAGQIHALMGENGAGKSTLIKVLTGAVTPTSGTVRLSGEPIHPTSPMDAVRLGISTVYQEVNLAPNLSVAENICLGREPRGITGIRWRAMETRAKKALAKLGLSIDVRRSLSSYSVAIQQLTAIARALDVSAQVLILDEPTSSLDADETAELFRVLRSLRDGGLGIVFVTHFLDQVYAVSDQITILRNGSLVGTHRAADLARLDLVSLMIGRNASEIEGTGNRAAASVDPGRPILGLEDVSVPGGVGGVTFGVCPAEVVGLAGLLGSGRTETMRAIFGIDAIHSGKLTLEGRTQTRYGIGKAIRAGLGLCPEDRKVEGILPGLTVRENLTLVMQGKRGWLRRIPLATQRKIVDEYIQRLRIATPDAEKPIEQLSGGNQQKVLLARWLASSPRLMLLDEPTRGIDVGAKFEIMQLVESLRQEGMAFVFVSSEFEEVVRSSTKVVVLRDRRMVAQVEGDQINQETIMGKIAGVDA